MIKYGMRYKDSHSDVQSTLQAEIRCAYILLSIPTTPAALLKNRVRTTLLFIVYPFISEFGTREQPHQPSKTVRSLPAHPSYPSRAYMTAYSSSN